MIFFFKVNNMKYWHPHLPFGQHISVSTLALRQHLLNVKKSDLARRCHYRPKFYCLLIWIFCELGSVGYLLLIFYDNYPVHIKSKIVFFWHHYENLNIICLELEFYIPQYLSTTMTFLKFYITECLHTSISELTEKFWI